MQKMTNAVLTKKKLDEPGKNREALIVFSRRAIRTPGYVSKLMAGVLLGGVLITVGLVASRGIRKGEFNYNVDETQHAVTGLYAADLIHDHPLRHPIRYTYRYYAQYPALSGVLHWPPLFYVVEGISFAVFGPHVEAARATVLLFALVGLVFWFRLVTYLVNEWAAALTTFLLGLLPSILLFEESVMLEIPCLALCTAATYYWFKFLLDEDQRALPWFAGFASAAAMTKQNSVYLVLFCVLSVLVLGKHRLLWTRRALWIAALACLVTVPFYAAVYVIHWRTIAIDLAEPSSSLSRRLLFYPGALPNQLGGWMLLLLAGLGVATARWWNKRPEASTLMVLWIVSCYLTFTVIGHKEARYALYWIPPFLYFAGGLLANDQLWRSGRAWKSVAACLLLANAIIVARHYDRPRVEGYAAAAHWVTNAGKQGVILYDGDLPGNFIFFVRANDPRRRFVVLRKALYAFRITASRGSEDLVHSKEELQDLIRRSGIRYVLIGNNREHALVEQHWLSEVLQTRQFGLAATFPISTTDRDVHIRELECYENLDWQPPSDKDLRIRMLTINHDIVVPFSELFGTGAR
jgi:hypothetical protein